MSNAVRHVICAMWAVIVLIVSATPLMTQSGVYLLHIDREKQRMELMAPDGRRVRFVVERETDGGKVVRQRLDYLPVCTKTVRFVAPEGPAIPEDPYGRYCELPPADGIDGNHYTVGPIEEIPQGSKDFGFFKIRLTGPPADAHGRRGLLIHGGGRSLKKPLADFQGWQCTHGCVRLQNVHVKSLVSALRSLPTGADVRLTVDGGKCRINGIVAETYRWDARAHTWRMLSTAP